MGNLIIKITAAKWFFYGIGLVNLVLFHVAITRLFFFLYDSSMRVTYSSLAQTLVVNLSLIFFFSLPHSWLLKSKVKKKVVKYLPSYLYSSFYSLHASLGILLMDKYWGDMGMELYRLTKVDVISFDGVGIIPKLNLGDWESLLLTLPYIASWLFMLYAMVSTGLFRQSGLEEWWAKYRGKSYKYDLKTHGAYGMCRHPIYAAFLAMLWTSPVMTLDHLFLSVGWSVYIFWGAGQKEARLFKNKAYKKYAEKVRSFPFLPKAADHLITRHLWKII